MVLNKMYKGMVKPYLFTKDPEDVHENITKIGILLSKHKISRAAVRKMFCYSSPALNTNVAGISFDNPIGLSAGFDKNAKLYNILPDVGFGFAELGSVTGEKCSGNPRPRLFRLPKEKSILVNYGLCNDGCEAISERLKNVKFRIPIGISIAKTNDPLLDTEAGIKDYRKAFITMHPIGSYTTINVSCPNTYGGQTFGHPENLEPLLKTLAKERHIKPVFIKIKPDMNQKQLSEIIKIAENHDWVTGFIISNLTMNREGLKTSKEELDKVSIKGGLSGLPVKQRSNDTLKFVHQNTGKILIGCGGIFEGKDAYEKFKLGASLVQMITGLIYEGPGVVSKVNRELAELIKKDGYKNISEVMPKN